MAVAARGAVVETVAEAVSEGERAGAVDPSEDLPILIPAVQDRLPLTAAGEKVRRARMRVAEETTIRARVPLSRQRGEEGEGGDVVLRVRGEQLDAGRDAGKRVGRRRRENRAPIRHRHAPARMALVVVGVGEHAQLGHRSVGRSAALRIADDHAHRVEIGDGQGIGDVDRVGVRPDGRVEGDRLYDPLAVERGNSRLHDGRRRKRRGGSHRRGDGPCTEGVGRLGLETADRDHAPGQSGDREKSSSTQRMRRFRGRHDQEIIRVRGTGVGLIQGLFAK
ncbi:hypothetical protein ABE10_31495 [Bacillus toyonensis]|nr:hypothetical protein [Bacillus toyonensis]